MNWNNLFKGEKPINIYESSLYEEWLDDIGVSEHSKQVYRTYAVNLAGWIRESGYTTLGTSEAENYLIYYTEKSGAKQAHARWSLFKRYCDWLIVKGKLTVNPWDNCDLGLCGCDKLAVAENNRALLEARRAREAAVAEKKANTEETEDAPRFTLTDVALLLIAIEEHDEKSIVEILSK